MASRSFFTGKQGAQFQAERVVRLAREQAPVQHVSDPRERRVVNRALLSVQDVADQLGVSKRTVYRLIDEDDLPVTHVRSLTRIDQFELDAWTFRQRQPHAKGLSVLRGGRK